MWVPWLRSLELDMDEWSWAVLQGEVLPHGKVKELMEMDQSKRTVEEQEGINRVLEEASKGRDARQSKKSIANWKKEMEKDPGAFCTVIRDTERLVMQELQNNTKGEAHNIVVGIQITDECGRKAFQALKTVYGRAKADDTNTIISRLRGGLTFEVGDGYRSVEEGDDIAVHIRVLEDLRTRIEVTKSSIADGDVVKYVDLLISDPIMHHMLLTTLPPTLRTESARTYETKESKSWSALKSWCAETQERLVRDGMYTAQTQLRLSYQKVLLLLVPRLVLAMTKAARTRTWITKRP